jgi:hypothetical protein
VRVVSSVQHTQVSTHLVQLVPDRFEGVVIECFKLAHFLANIKTLNDKLIKLVCALGDPARGVIVTICVQDIGSAMPIQFIQRGRRGRKQLWELQLASNALSRMYDDVIVKLINCLLSCDDANLN